MLLGFVTLTFAAGQYRLLEFDRSSGGAFGLFQATQSVELLSTLVLPLMFLIGLDIAAFVLNIGEFGTHFVEDRFAGKVLPVIAAITAVLAIAQTFFVLRDTFDEPHTCWRRWPARRCCPSASRSSGSSCTRAGESSGLKTRNSSTAARSWAPLLVVLIFLPLILQTLLLLSLNFVNATKITTNLDVIQHWEDLSRWIFDRQALWSDILGVAFILCAAWLVMRHRRSAALFVGGVGVATTWLQLTGADGWLSDWGTTRSRTTSVWVLALLVAATMWIARRQLSRHRVRGLLLAFGLAILLGQQGFLEDPIGVLSFLGIALIAMGFVADAAAYGDWANHDSARLPRVSRVLMYVGYTLFAVALVNWALVTHDLSSTNLYTGQGALAGFAFLGQPLIFLVFLAVITSRPDPVTAPPRGAAASATHGGPAAAAELRPPPRPPVGRHQLACSASLTMVGVRECLRLLDDGRRQGVPSASLSFASTDVRCASEIG